MKRLQALLDWGGIQKGHPVSGPLRGRPDLPAFFDLPPLPFDAAWVAIILCGVPIVLEAVIGLVTAFDIKADVLVSMALIASVIIGEDFAAGEVAFIMQLGGLLEELTVARARAGIEKLVRLTPRTARVLTDGREPIIPAEAGPGGRPAPGAARGDHSGGRRHPLRADLHQPGGDDRGIPARGQRPGGRGIQRHGQSVRLL